MAIPPASPSVAVAIPAYNEDEGIGGFLREIDRALSPHTQRLRLIVVDDGSTDATRDVIDAVRPELSGELELIATARNLGHGPALLVAYRAALASDPDYVLQVDGDGQFLGSDLRRLLVLLTDDAGAVSGVRRFRQDPWFRMAMTRLLRSYVHLCFGVTARDPNCPLRGYEAHLLGELLDALPERCLIPNLYLSVLAARWGLELVEVDVSHRVRRGSSARGSSWGPSLVPWRLIRFSGQALAESWRQRDAIRTARRPAQPDRERGADP